MHIAEGVLSTPVLVGGWVVGGGLLAWSLRGMQDSELPKTALLSALFFVGSFIHVPLGPTSVHLMLSGLVGVLLGGGVFAALFVALLLQALLFGFGGLTTLGTNLLLMALPAWILGMGFATLRRRAGVVAAAFAAGVLSVLGSALLLSCVLWFSGEAFEESAALAFASYVPIAIVEGVITLFVVQFVARVQPEVLSRGR